MKSLPTVRKIKAHETKPEVRFRARPVSRGVAIGRIVCLYGENRQFYRSDIELSQTLSEIDRFRTAYKTACKQLKKAAAAKNGQPEAATGIFEAHLSILQDSSLREQIETAIENEKVNAEWAVKLITDELLAKYKAIQDENLRDRYIDIEDVAERLHTALGGEHPAIKLEHDSIVAAKELRPSTLVELSESNPKAVITENGGWTSHTFIVAREVRLPAVTGLKKLTRRVKTGDNVIVDGYNGQIILHPTRETIAKYAVAAAQFEEINYDDIETAGGAIKTLDGREIVIRANFDIPSSFRKAKRLGAQGIGLYRSEFLFNHYKGFPTEAEQVKAYREIADFAGEDGARIRTFDLSVDQLLDQTTLREKNPALGLRAIRLGLSNPKQFRTQIRAILQAAAGRKIDIVLPMVTGCAEIRIVRNLMEREAASLEKRGVEFGTPRLGAMIEVPSAVLGIKHLVDEADCLCLGTNDLVQYLLAVDRDNETVADWFRTLHPAVIQALDSVISASNAAGKPVVICGEMAGSPFYIPILIGLGAAELSMNVNSILRVRKVIAGIAYEEARELTRDIAACRTADEIESTAAAFYQAHWSHLFPPDMLTSRKM